MNDTEWIESLVSDIAKKYRVVLHHDDPVLVTAILNKELLDKAHRDQQELFVKNSQLLQHQFKAHRQMNELLISEVSQRLVQSIKVTLNDQHDVMPRGDNFYRGGSFDKALLLLMFMFGLVLGILIGRFI